MRRRTTVRALLAAIACALAALALAAWIAPELVRGVRSLSWPSTGGTLLAAGRGWTVDVRRSGKRPIVQWLDLRYAYTVPGAEGRPLHLVGWAFDASTPTDGQSRHPYSIALEAMATEAMRAAPDVEVWYDPRDPSVSLLHRGVPFGTALLLLPCLVLAGAAWLLTRGGTRQPRFVPWCILFPIAGFAVAATLVGLCRHRAGSVPPSWTMLAYEAVGVIALLRPDWCVRRPLVYPIRAALAAFPFAAVWAVLLWAGEASREVHYAPSDATIVQQLAHPHPEVAASAAWTIRDRRGPTAAIPALGRCLDSPEPGVRSAAIAAIESLGPTAHELAPRLEQLARDEPDERCRGCAARALRSVRG